MSESVEQDAPNIDVTAEAAKLLETVENANLDTLLHEYVIPYGTKILIAIAIYVVGKWIARVVSHLLGKIALASTKDEMLQSFVSSISYFLFLLIIIIASLSQLGINTSSLVALIGAAGLAVAMALQSSLQNFASGVMLLIFKPFKKGDFIEASGVSGKVEQMGLLLLELRTGDNKSVLIPNSKVFGDSITNYSRNETRRVDFIFDISYESDIPLAKEIIARCLQENELILRDPEPVIVVGALESSSVQIFARPWVRTSNYWTVHFALLEKVKLEFDKAGISIPYNQLDLHLPDNHTIKIEKH